MIDDESDYFSVDANQWLSEGQREALRKREEEVRQKRHGSRLDRKITFDFAGEVSICLSVCLFLFYLYLYLTFILSLASANERISLLLQVVGWSRTRVRPTTPPGTTSSAALCRKEVPGQAGRSPSTPGSMGGPSWTTPTGPSTRTLTGPGRRCAMTTCTVHTVEFKLEILSLSFFFSSWRPRRVGPTRLVVVHRHRRERQDHLEEDSKCDMENEWTCIFFSDL